MDEDISTIFIFYQMLLINNKKNKIPINNDITENILTKLFVSNTVKSFMLQAMQIFGGYGYLTEFGIEQEVRDALAATIYSGTSEIQKNIIASNLGI